MAETAGAIVGVIQRRLGDVEATLLTPTFCIGYINDAQTRVANRLRANGVSRFRKQSGAITIAAGTGMTYIDKTTTPALPTDFLDPITIWEKPTGAPDTDYRIVTLLRGDIPPYQQQDTTLRDYIFQAGQLKFEAPSSSVQILMDYVCSLGDFITPNDVVPVFNTVQAIGLTAAALISGGRDGPDLTIMGEAGEEIRLIIVEATRLDQRKARRRRPFHTQRLY